jgi:hypothetical protein
VKTSKPDFVILCLLAILALLGLGALTAIAGNHQGGESSFFAPMVFGGGWIFVLYFFGVVTGLLRRPYPSPELEKVAGPGAGNLPQEKFPGAFATFFLVVWVIVWYGSIFLFVGFFGTTLSMIFCAFLCAWLTQLLLVQGTSRQDELARVLVAAATHRASLAEAIRALAADSEPQGVKVWIHAIGRTILLPGWGLVRGRAWEWPARLRRLARRLECGQTLGQAISVDPKLVPPSHRVSSDAALGDIGLVGFLDREPPLSSGLLWLEIFPRMMYPILLLVFVGGLLSFHATFLAPKMQRIFRDFNLEPTGLGAWAVNGEVWLPLYGWVTFGGTILILLIGILTGLGPSTRWWLPFARFLYRPEVLGGVLRRMGKILERGHTEVEAVASLEADPGLPRGMRKRLARLGKDLKAGGAFVECLGRRLHLKRGEKALLEASLRARQLPWILSEIGEKKIRNTIARIGWFSQLLLIVCVLLIGTLVGMVAFSWFAPLVQLIEVLAE